MKKINCLLCPQANFRVLYEANFNPYEIDGKIFSARRIPDKCHYRIVQCETCGLIFSNPIFTEKKIENLYRRSKLTYEREIANLKRTYGAYLQQMKFFLQAKNRLLEIGCGSGFFLEEAQNEGFKEVWGVDPSPEAVKKSSPKIRKNILIDFFRPDLFKDNLFDIICFFQTLDHIVDPNKFLQGCYKILKKGGIVFCITHNAQAFSRKLLGEKSPIFDIEHIYLFNKETIRKIFEKNKFKVIKIFNVANIYSLDYWLQMLPLPSPLRRLLVRLSLDLGINEKKIKLAAGNIGIIARKV